MIAEDPSDTASTADERRAWQPSAATRDLLESFDWLRGKPYEVEELPGGQTNITVKVTVDGRSAVVREALESSGALSIDRDAEWYNTQAAALAGVSPAVLDKRESPRALVVEYVDATSLANADLDSPAMLTRVASTLRQLHEGPRFVNTFNMFDIHRLYLDRAVSGGFRIPRGYEEHLPKIKAMERVFARTGWPLLPCNNDLICDNFLDDDKRLWIIDYEYGGNNDPYFELGNVWSEAKLSVDRLHHLVESYDGEHNPRNVSRARLWGMLSQYTWTLWAAIQNAVCDEIDFDYWGWALEKYERALRELNSGDFGQLLRDAQ